MTSPTKSCSLDPAPTFLVREMLRSTIHHWHGQCVAGRRSTARLTEARDRVAVAEEADLDVSK